jgi:hypothetical protein
MGSRQMRQEVLEFYLTFLDMDQGLPAVCILLLERVENEAGCSGKGKGRNG